MKKGDMKKWAALILSVLLCFSSLAFSMEMRALAEEDGSSEGTEVTELKTEVITISDISADLVYNGSDFNSEIRKVITTKSGRTPNIKFYRGTSVSGNEVKFIDAGEYTVVASLEANNEYTGGSAEHIFEIKRAPITKEMVGAIADQTYTGSEIRPEPIVFFNGDTLLYKGTDYDLTYMNNQNPGTATVIVQGKANFKGDIPVNFNILPVEKTAQVFDDSFSQDQARIYGDSDFTIAATLLTGNGNITYSSSDPSVATVSDSTGRVSIRKAGETIITATAAETGSYTKTSISYKLTVGKADITVKASDKRVNQGGSVPSLSSPVLDRDYVVSGLARADSLRGEAYMTYQKDGKNVTPDPSVSGTYDIVISGFFPPNENNYNSEIIFEPGLLTIENVDKLTQVFDGGFAEDVTKVYGDSAFVKTASLATGDGALTYESSDPSVAEVSAGGVVSIKKAGQTTITARAAETESYSEATVSYTLTVNKADITVSAIDRRISLGERAPDLSEPVQGVDYTVSGLVGSDTLLGEASMKYQKDGADAIPDTSELGSYAIVISGLYPPLSDNYNDVVFDSGVLTIQRGSGSGGLGVPIVRNGDVVIRGWSNVIDWIKGLINGTGEGSDDEGDDGTAREVPVATIDMNGSTVIVKELLEAIRGERIIVRFVYDNGIVWIIDGRNVDLIDKARDIDLGVVYGGDTGSHIPADAVRSVTTGNTKHIVRLRMRYYSSLGLETTLSFNAAKATGETVTSQSISRLYGLVANLYYYNASEEKLEFLDYGYIDEKGNVDYVLKRTYSDYVIVLDTSRLGGTADVMRVYNPNSGRHHLSISRDEINNLMDLGWRYEGIAFTADMGGKDDIAVYRLYNPYSGEHLFTADRDEGNRLVYLGWKNEGVAWYSDSGKTVPVFRFYNPNAGDHHFTINQNEISNLVVEGWRNEGIAFYSKETVL